MPEYKIHIAQHQHYSCLLCGRCCRRFHVRLEKAECIRLANLDWQGEPNPHDFTVTINGHEYFKRNADGGCVFLDEKGAEYRSLDFAAWLEKQLAGGGKSLVFAIGGAYGFSDAVYARAREKVSLSKMTFSHQLVRTIFAEQLYRAFTILKGEPYHHE